MTRTLALSCRLLLTLLAVAVSQLATAGAAHAEAGVEVTKTSELNPAGESVTVSGSGFQAGVTLFVVACDPAIENGGACDMANFVQVKTDTNGGFEADLKLVASFGTTDCLKVPCAIMTSKVGDGADRSQETTVPISFTGGVMPEETPSATESETSAPATDDDSDASEDSDKAQDSDSSALIVVGGVVIVALLAGAALLFRRKRPTT